MASRIGRASSDEEAASVPATATVRTAASATAR